MKLQQRRTVGRGHGSTWRPAVARASSSAQILSFALVPALTTLKAQCFFLTTSLPIMTFGPAPLSLDLLHLLLLSHYSVKHCSHCPVLVSPTASLQFFFSRRRLERECEINFDYS